MKYRVWEKVILKQTDEIAVVIRAMDNKYYLDLNFGAIIYSESDLAPYPREIINITFTNYNPIMLDSLVRESTNGYWKLVNKVPVCIRPSRFVVEMKDNHIRIGVNEHYLD